MQEKFKSDINSAGVQHHPSRAKAFCFLAIQPVKGLKLTKCIHQLLASQAIHVGDGKVIMRFYLSIIQSGQWICSGFDKKFYSPLNNIPVTMVTRDGRKDIQERKSRSPYPGQP